jgi:signal transduction histidine kinase
MRTEFFVSIADGRARLHVDSLQIEVVLRNLLANAFDSVAENREGRRRIDLSVRTVGDSRLRIEVADNGPGLVVDMRDDLFEAFRTTKSHGMGLGLAISRAIVDSHGGKVGVEERDRTVFYVELPLDMMTNQGERNAA